MDIRKQLEVIVVRQPSRYVTVAGVLPQVVPTAPGGEDLVPGLNPDGTLDGLYRRDWLCRSVGDELGVPRGALMAQRYRVVFEPIGDPFRVTREGQTEETPREALGAPESRG